MLIAQEEFFDVLDIKETEIEYVTGKRKCFKGSDGYYRIDHFGNSYVIEYAETEEEAKQNIFEDGDLFDDSLSKSDLIEQIQNALLQNNTFLDDFFGELLE